jgi:GNAT superfamily N-acetyltransferase
MRNLGSIYECDTDKDRLDFDFIQAYLSDQSYWAKGRSKTRMQKAIANSLCFGLYKKESGRQLGFARIATDYVVFAWLMDVFIAPEYQGQGLGKFLIQSILDHPSLQEVRGIGLKTKDAHGLYQQFGFARPNDPEAWMCRKGRK